MAFSWRPYRLLSATTLLLSALATAPPVAAREDCFALALGHTGLGADPVASPLGTGLVWIEQTIDQSLVDWAGVVDVDGDGDLDVLGIRPYADEVVWFENLDGQGRAWTEHTVDTDVGGVRAVDAADIDQDDDVDLVVVGDEAMWLENVAGNGRNWTSHAIDASLGSWYVVDAADIDGDGDTDLLGTFFDWDPIAGGDSEGLCGWPWEYQVFWFENLSGDGQVWSTQCVEGDVMVYRGMTVDIDGDGDLDVLGSRWYDHEIAWWENVAGDGLTWTQHVVEPAVTFPGPVDAADLDGDGDTDVVATSSEGIAWWENLDGDGSSWREIGIDSDERSEGPLGVADVDGDSDPDLLVSFYDAQALIWWDNVVGDGSVWDERAIDSLQVSSVDAGDLDGDGDLDILGASPDLGEVIWWENVYHPECPEGQYAAGQRVDLTADPDPGSGVDGWSGTEDDASRSTENLVIMPAADHQVAVHYLEGCFRLALTHTGMGADPVTPTLARSEGCDAGSYVVGERIGLSAAPDVGWEVAGWVGTDDDTGRELSNSVIMPAADHLVSVDYRQGCYPLTVESEGQGAKPTVEPERSPDCTTGYHRGEVVTLTASPDPGYEVGVWVGTDDDTSREPINTVTTPGVAHRVTVIYIEECFALSLNHTGSGADPLASPPVDGSSWLEWTVDGEFAGAASIVDADVDGDGDSDIVGAASDIDEVRWWENLDGEGRTWSEHAVDRAFDGARSVFPGDLDGDGDLDVLGAASDADAVRWWENFYGDGRDWIEHSIADGFDGAWSVASADLDGDGDLDVLGAAFDADEIAWWENVSGDGLEWRWSPIDPEFDGARSVASADVDGDGDVDVLGAAEYAEISWWENLAGDGSVWAEHEISETYQGAQSAVAADVDGDGDLDVVGAEWWGGGIAWWENLSGDGLVWRERPVDESFAGARSVQVGDVDGDGDLDVLGALETADEIAWWKNLSGDGVAWSEHVIRGEFDAVGSVHAADVDGDGFLDALGAAALAGEVAWWENTFVPQCLAGEYQAGDRIGLTADPDPGWGVDSWSGTEDDTSRWIENLVIMPAADHAAAVHYVELGPGPVLSVFGVCPGDLSVRINGATPLGSVGLASSLALGESEVPAGACAGTLLALGSPDPLTLLPADETGEISLDRVAEEGACGYYIQAVDIETCLASNLGRIPE